MPRAKVFAPAIEWAEGGVPLTWMSSRFIEQARPQLGRSAEARELAVSHTGALAGEDDAVAKVRARDVRDLERVVMKQISGVPGVDRVRTNVVLSTHLERPVAVR